MMFFSRAVWLFSSPRRLVEHIREDRTAWWQPWVWLSLLYVVVDYFALPVRIAIMQTNPNDLSLSELDTQIAYMERYGELQLLGTPVALLFVGLIVCGITYVIVSLFSERATFKRYFTITLYSSVIAGMAHVISTAIVRARGIDSIRTAEDATFELSLRFAAPDDSPLLQALFSSVDLFGIWALVFLATALVGVFDMTPRQAVISVVPWWLLTVLVTLLGQAVGAMG